MKRDILQSQIFAADWLGNNWEIGKMYFFFFFNYLQNATVSAYHSSHQGITYVSKHDNVKIVSECAENTGCGVLERNTDGEWGAELVLDIY